MHRHIKIVIACAAGIAVVALFFWFQAPGISSPSAVSSATNDTLAQARQALSNLSVPSGAFTEIQPGLQVADITVGDGALATEGQTVVIHYVGRFTDGTQFDSSLDHGQPLAFVLGKGEVVKGMDEGVVGMRVGGVRRIIVPPELGYGSAGVTAADGTVVIPPNATLIFDVELVGVGNQ